MRRRDFLKRAAGAFAGLAAAATGLPAMLGGPHPLGFVWEPLKHPSLREYQRDLYLAIKKADDEIRKDVERIAKPTKKALKAMRKLGMEVPFIPQVGQWLHRSPDGRLVVRGWPQ